MGNLPKTSLILIAILLFISKMSTAVAFTPLKPAYERIPSGTAHESPRPDNRRSEKLHNLFNHSPAHLIDHGNRTYPPDNFYNPWKTHQDTFIIF